MAFSAIPALAGAITLAKLNYLTFDFKQQAWECHRKMHDQWRMLHKTAGLPVHERRYH